MKTTRRGLFGILGGLVGTKFCPPAAAEFDADDLVIPPLKCSYNYADSVKVLDNTGYRLTNITTAYYNRVALEDLRGKQRKLLADQGLI